MMLTGSVTEVLDEVVVREVAPPAVPSVVAGTGVASAAADGSPSRDRLARIAEMIRDAEQAGAASSPRQRQLQDAGLIPLASRRNRARLRRGRTVVVLAS